MKNLAHSAIIMLLIIYTGLNADFQNSSFSPTMQKSSLPEIRDFCQSAPAGFFLKNGWKSISCMATCPNNLPELTYTL